MPDKQSDPQTADRLNQIRAMLRQEDATSIAGSMGQLLIGAGVMFFAGILVATFMTFVLYTFIGSTFIGWSGWFLVYVLILAPAVVWYERKSRADYLGDAAQVADPNPSSRGEFKLNQAIIGVGLVANILVWGPRSIVDGFRGLRGLRTAKQHAAFQRASLLALDLGKAHGGVEIKRLVHPPEEMEVFGLAVDLLDKHGWIGKSTDGKSLWLNSTWRAKLLKVTS
jgi:hypothetical protein